MDRINELFESANDKRAREKEELMQLSEKELLADTEESRKVRYTWKVKAHRL